MNIVPIIRSVPDFSFFQTGIYKTSVFPFEASNYTTMGLPSGITITTGSLSNLNVGSIDSFMVMPRYRIILYTGTIFTGTVRLDCDNNSLYPISVQPTSFIGNNSLALYYNGVLIQAYTA